VNIQKFLQDTFKLLSFVGHFLYLRR